MGVIGSNSGGYATVAPTRNYIGEAMTNVQDTLFKQKAQRQADEKAQQDRELVLQGMQDKKDKEAIDYADKHKLTKTGIKSVDTKNYEIALKLRQLNVEGVNELSNAKTIEQKTAAMAKIQKASSGFDTINKFNNDYNANKEDLVKNIDKYDPNYTTDMSEYGKKFDNGQFEYSLDDDYNVRFNTHDIDPATGKVNEVTAANLSGDEMAAKFKGLPKSNYAGEGGKDSYLDAVKGKMSEYKREVNDGKGTITISYDEAKNQVPAAAQAGASNPSIAYKVRTMLSDELKVPKSQITNDQILKKISDDILANIPTGGETKMDEAYLNRQDRKQFHQDALNIQKTNQEIARDKKAEESRNITVTKETGGVFPTTRVTRKMTQAELDAENAKEFSNVRKTISGITIGKKGNDWYNTETKEKITIKKAKKAVKGKSKVDEYGVAIK